MLGKPRGFTGHDTKVPYGTFRGSWTAVTKGASSKTPTLGPPGASQDETERPRESKLTYLVLRLSEISPGFAACIPACKHCVSSESLSRT